MPDILFVCYANRFRSVIAAECFRFMLKEHNTPGEWIVNSAGTRGIDGAPPLKDAISFSASRGISLEGFRSREITHTLVTAADLVVVMTADQREAIACDFPEAKDKTIQLSEVCIGQVFDIPDPIFSPEEDPQAIAAEICALLEEGFNNILKKVDVSQSD